MGIPRFASWVFNIRGRPVAINSTNMPSNIASLSFDLNSIIHGCAQIVYGYGEGESDQRLDYIDNLYAENPQRASEQLEKELFKLIGDTILRIVMRIQPKKLLVLAVDGVAPLAKINQQRGRRYRSASEKKDSRVKFDSNCITPGTDLMFRLDSFLNDWIKSNMSLLPENVHYSSHLSNGEGEQKIFDTLSIFSDTITSFGSQVIYGLDADLIVLSLISEIKSIYLVREKSMEANIYEKVIAIEQLRDHIFYRMRKMKTAIDDFAVLTYFIGNDFLPSSPMFSGDIAENLEFLIDTYNILHLPLTYPDKGKIDMINFQKFIRLLASTEADRLKELSKNLPREGFATLKDATEIFVPGGRTEYRVNMQQFKKNWYVKVFFPPLTKLDMASQLPSEIFLKLFEPTDDKIQELVMDYVSAFKWIYFYYKIRQPGSAKIKSNPNFCYTSPYAPLISDVKQFFPKEVYPATNVDLEENYGLFVIQQLLAVLPPQSLAIVPKALHVFYGIDSPIVDMFPKQVTIDFEGKNMKHQGVVIMPSVQPKRLLDLNLEDYMSYNEKLNYTPKPPNTWKKEKVQVIDRQINPATIKVTKEKIQDELELPETFTHLDVTTPAKGIFISDTPTVQDIINRNPEEFRQTKESTTIKKSPALKSAFAKQFELLKNMRKK
jgi:5'-3' exonuclease